MSELLWLTVLLVVIIQSPLVTDLVCLSSADFIKALRRGRSQATILKTRQASVCLIRSSQLHKFSDSVCDGVWTVMGIYIPVKHLNSLVTVLSVVHEACAQTRWQMWLESIEIKCFCLGSFWKGENDSAFELIWLWRNTEGTSCCTRGFNFRSSQKLRPVV